MLIFSINTCTNCSPSLKWLSRILTLHYWWYNTIKFQLTKKCNIWHLSTTNMRHWPFFVLFPDKPLAKQLYRYGYNNGLVNFLCAVYKTRMQLHMSQWITRNVRVAYQTSYVWRNCHSECAAAFVNERCNENKFIAIFMRILGIVIAWCMLIMHCERRRKV